MIRAEIVQDPSALEGFRDTWRELFGKRPHEPSASFEWTRGLLNNHLKPGDQFLLVILREGDRICGIVPLATESRTIAGLTLVMVAPLSERSNTHSDLLISPVSESVVRCFLEALLSLPCRWDVFSMGRLIEGGLLTACLESQLKRLRAPIRSRLGAPSFILPLPKSFEEYLSRRSGKFRNFLRRAEKRLSAAGRVTFLRAGADLEQDASYTALLDIETRSWKHRHGTAISAIDRQRGFYEELCRSLSAAGHLHLTFLALDDTPIAYNLGLVYGSTYYCLKTSFDEELRRHSPGTVARSRLLASLIGSGLRTFDFPGEPYEWEAQWTRELQWHRSLVLFNRTLRGRFCSLAQRVRDRGRAVTGKRELAYVDPRSLRPGRADGRIDTHDETT